MKKKIKIKSKQNYRSISNRDTPINMQKLKKKYINKQKDKILNFQYNDYTQNTQNEVNYAENQVENYAINTLNYAKNAFNRDIDNNIKNESSLNNEIRNRQCSIHKIENELAKRISIHENVVENNKFRIKQKYETQQIYQKVYFIKSQVKYVRN